MVAGLDSLRLLTAPAGSPGGLDLPEGRVLLVQACLTRPLGEAAQLGQPVRHPVHRGPGDDQQPEPADQREQRRGDPRRQPGHQRGRDEEADDAAAGPHGAHSGRRLRRARRDVHQAEAAQQQAGPADHHPPGLRVAVGVAQEPPGEQAEQQGHGPGGRAERAEEQVGQHPPGEVVHVEPGGGGHDEGRRQEGQAHAVPLVQRVQVPRAAAEPARTEPGRVRDHHPQPGDEPAQPARQDQDRVRGPLRRPRGGPAGASRARRPLPALSRPVLPGTVLPGPARPACPAREELLRPWPWPWRGRAGIAFLLVPARELAGRPAPPDVRWPSDARACPAAGRACPPGASPRGRGVPLATRVAMMPKVPTIGVLQAQPCGRVAMIFWPG